MRKSLFFVLLLTVTASLTYGQRVLTGFIKDGKGLPVEAASVKVKGSTITTVADIKGKFSITAPSELPFTLLISSTGYYPSELEVSTLKDSVLNIILVDNNQLSE